jgi:uncharacterized protein
MAMPPGPAQAVRAAHWRSVWKRRFAKYSRWLHVYLSMASFVVVFFFAVTGLTLNHTEWFEAAGRTTKYTGSIDPKWASGPTADSVAKLEIVEQLRRVHAVRGSLTDFLIDEAQCTVSFRGPGYTADAFIDRGSGRYELTVSRLGLAAVANDLHKGRDTGAAWKLLIDLSAALLTLVSLSGLALIFFIHKHRTAGLLALASGGLLLALVYAGLVQ